MFLLTLKQLLQVAYYLGMQSYKYEDTYRRNNDRKRKPTEMFIKYTNLEFKVKIVTEL